MDWDNYFYPSPLNILSPEFPSGYDVVEICELLKDSDKVSVNNAIIL
jgi:hypothetical protein